MNALEQKLEQLSLTTMSQQLEAQLAEAATRNLSFAQTLESLVDRELEARSQRAVERRFRLSRLPDKPSIDAFHFSTPTSRVSRPAAASCACWTWASSPPAPTSASSAIPA